MTSRAGRSSEACDDGRGGGGRPRSATRPAGSGSGSAPTTLPRKRPKFTTEPPSGSKAPVQLRTFRPPETPKLRSLLRSWTAFPPQTTPPPCRRRPSSGGKS
ncbi:pathogenesis-related genes transcriptional activator pti6 [Phtheirospermum japonicum]|uniref:Pathogenesis-related genes transcriptional activator pti6 n=1 Tax=Phtheirospermum japonicum TaxID=374723 RepID=A0A830AZP2_9LAMI|nr:pathogenesis-related genes transcriptional activator pti6 [Phtheirospermum japonicum]